MQGMMRALVVFLMAIALAGCMSRSQRILEETDIREATYRYQFDHNESCSQHDAHCFCLSMSVSNDVANPTDADDSDDAFIRRFATNQPPVKRVSECEVSWPKGVTDKKTGDGPGLIFVTGRIRWISNTEVDIGGGYYEASESASGNTYRLKKIEGKWKVVKDTMGWIS